MSAENVEVARRWLAAMSSSADEAQSRVAEFFDPDLDYYPVRKFPEARPCHGREELAEFIAQFWEPFTASEWSVHELTPVGDDRVLVRSTLRAQGRGSGVRLEGDLYQCFWLRHGRIFRLEDHLTVEGARHALGLRDQA